MMAAFLLALAIAAALVGASGWLVLGVTDLDQDHEDGDQTPGRTKAQGFAALITGVVGLVVALTLAFAAGRA